MSDLERLVVRNAELQRYLRQLAELVGREVSETELDPPEEATRLKEAAVGLKQYPNRIIELTPEELTQGRFASFIQRLARANSSPVSIWLNATPSCGVFYLSRADNLNCSFRFSQIPEGVIVLLTQEGADKLLLDFSPDEVVLELQGVNWGNVEY